MDGSSFDELNRSDNRLKIDYSPVEGDFRDNFILAVAMRLGDTPVLIPNTMVKT